MPQKKFIDFKINEEQIITILNRHFLYVGCGKKSPFYEVLYYKVNPHFWIIPGQKYFIVYEDNENELEIFQIFHNNNEVLIKPAKDTFCYTKELDDKGFGDIKTVYFLKLSPEEILNTFGKKYNFLFYHLEKLT